MILCQMSMGRLSLLVSEQSPLYSNDSIDTLSVSIHLSGNAGILCIFMHNRKAVYIRLKQVMIFSGARS